MRERVVIKWGGGLITQKQTLKAVRTDILDRLTKQLETVLAHGIDVILVHGAGSFGHLKAKQYRLAEGKIPSQQLPTGMTQEDAVQEVRRDMLELNDAVMQALTRHDITAVSLPPHHWAKNTGPTFLGSLDFFENAPQGIVLVTHGDVVDCDDEREFGILSGDDIVVRLAVEISGVKRLVFAMGGVEGVLSHPPQHPLHSLVEILHESDFFQGEHSADVDVTGGIGLKVSRGFLVQRHGVEVSLVSGEHDHRVADACLGLPVRGTKLQS